MRQPTVLGRPQAGKIPAQAARYGGGAEEHTALAHPLAIKPHKEECVAVLAG
jgi:hypothetical protein